ncbi:MAG: hypothetical protein RIC35_13525 [Marinoscillum sp.]
MKVKFVIIVCLLNVTISTYSQTSKGGRFVGANFNVSGGNSESENPNDQGFSKKFSFGVHPYVGYYINDNHALGLIINYSLSNSRSEHDDNVNQSIRDNHSQSIGGGVFLRRNFLIHEKIHLFIQPEIILSFQNILNTDSLSFVQNGSQSIQRNTKTDVNTTDIRANFRAGLIYFLGPHFSVEANIFTLGATNSSRTIIQSQGESASGQGGGSSFIQSEELNQNNFDITFNFTNNFSLTDIFTVNYYF